MSDAWGFGRKLLAGLLKFYVCFFALRVTATGLGLGGRDLVFPVGNVNTLISGLLLAGAVAVLLLEGRPQTTGKA